MAAEGVVVVEKSADGKTGVLVEFNADGLLIVDGEGRVRFGNPAAARLFAIEQQVADLALLADAVVGLARLEVRGQVRIGGDYQGANAAVPNARRTYVDIDSTNRRCPSA